MDIEILKKLSEDGNFSELNRLIMEDTLEMCETDSDLINAVENSISKQYIVFGDKEFEVDSKSWNSKIKVSRKRTYEAVKSYEWKRVAVLDFANYYSVWWAPFSAWAQEESMCRCSTLYPCINTKENQINYYQKHYVEWNKWIIDNYGWDDIIYVPDVVVFKTDVSIPEILDRSDWFKTDVIVAAAPEFWRWYPYSQSKFKNVMRNRVKRILDVAYSEKVEVLILWAFGCGAFKNPPEIVAQIFKEELKNYDFETVEFAIHGRRSKPNLNFEIFDRVLFWKEYVDLSRFMEAQKGSYDIALRELSGWRKQTHWMRYIFPQIRWLWHSDNANFYGIQSWKEAKAYYNDAVLKERLHELCKVLIGLDTNDAEEIFWWIDAMKLQSCITLFLQVAPSDKILKEILNKFFDWRYDLNTLDILNHMQD